MAGCIFIIHGLRIPAIDRQEGDKRVYGWDELHTPSVIKVP